MNMNVRRPEGVELRASEGVSLKPTLADFAAADKVSWRHYLVYSVLAGGGAYFVATASVTTLLVAGGILAGLVGLLVAVGIYAINNTIDWC